MNAPKLDASLLRISKNSKLPFKDMGILKGPMGKKAEGFLRRTWKSAPAGLKQDLATTFVVRALDIWQTQLKELIEPGSEKEQLLEGLAVVYIANA